MPISRTMLLLAYTLLVGTGLSLGCKPSPPDEPAETAQKKDDHGHDHEHDHDHDHEEGPNGGHLLALKAEGGETEQYQAEWLHDDEQGIVTVFLLHDDQPLDPSLAPESISIEVRAGNNPTTYELPKTPSEEDPNDLAYVIEDPALVTALGVVVEDQEPVLSASIGGTIYQGVFEEHDHHHHH